MDSFTGCFLTGQRRILLLVNASTGHFVKKNRPLKQFSACVGFWSNQAISIIIDWVFSVKCVRLQQISLNVSSFHVFPAGGEGSILAAAGAVIGVGSDIGGSIRMPCFFNGIFGHKPTPGKIKLKIKSTHIFVVFWQNQTQYLHSNILDYMDDNYYVSVGVVSCDHQYPPVSGRQVEYLSSGPMCRYAEDLKPMLKIMAGPNADM